MQLLLYYLGIDKVLPYTYNENKGRYGIEAYDRTDYSGVANERYACCEGRIRGLDAICANMVERFVDNFLRVVVY